MEIIIILSVSSNGFLHAETCKKSSDETEIIIFSGEINLLWQLYRLWVFFKLHNIYIYILELGGLGINISG